MDPSLHVTLWPSFTHFGRFSADRRLAGIRLNSAMMHAHDLEKELAIVAGLKDPVPLWFDIKGRQLRVTEVLPNHDRLELLLNHPIQVKTPTIVLFKAGGDFALLNEVVDGNRLVFEGGPKWMVYAGESLHIRDASLRVGGGLFTDAEAGKIKRVLEAGFERFYLSYVESQRDVDEFREHVGAAPVVCKIENKKGLEFAASFRKVENTTLMAARGDLFVELERPHEILMAMRLIVSRDPEAFAGSRILLSVIKDPVPDCADFSDLAWLRDVGYRNMLLCDELCLKEELLSRAVNVFDAFRRSYQPPVAT